jgi:predicted flap endonuclease-1-like 5' DNA nuclease
MAKLEEIEGIGSSYAQKLRKAGVRSTNELLKKGATPAGRKEISKNSGVTEKLILEWVNHSDLFRVKGIGSEYADLLEEAGVDTVVELGKRNAPKLLEAMTQTNQKKKLVRQLPGQSKVDDWIKQAKKLPRAIKY